MKDWIVGKIQQLTVKPEPSDLMIAHHALKGLTDRDARIAELENALREVDGYLDNAPTVRAIVRRAIKVGL